MAKTPSRESRRAKAAPAKAKPRLRTRTDLGDDAVRDISAGLAALLADTFALYLKTKNFHWHMSGPHFRDFHLLLDEQSDQIFAMTDPMAERARKIGGMTLHSIGEIARKQRIADNDADYVDPQDMLAELAERQPPVRRRHAQPARHLRRARRRGDRQPPRELDRRGRAPRLVPLRGHPHLTQHHLLSRAAQVRPQRLARARSGGWCRWPLHSVEEWTPSARRRRLRDEPPQTGWCRSCARSSAWESLAAVRARIIASISAYSASTFLYSS